MEDHSNSSEAAGQYHFLIRRLHSLSGLVPIGVFLCIHLIANASVLAPGAPGAEFQKSVERIRSLGPFLVPVEIIGIFIPLAFHILVGLMIWRTSSPNTQQYRHGGNVRYTAQRATGMIAFVFILYHLWQMHWTGKPFGGGAFEVHTATGAPAAAVTTATVIQAAWWVAPIYAIGVLSTVFHFANGVWTSLITWGITIRPKTQRASGYACGVFGVLLALVGMGALFGFKTFDITGNAPSPQAAAEMPPAGH